jgi:predicted regulator of Ras-like GTPase activity (Roadblock/LC7/MglB family)
VIQQILEELVSNAPGARAAIFLDMDGESIGHAGDTGVDIRLLGAWKEIHLDHIKDISRRLGMGNVDAVLFSLDEGNELIAPVAGEYCLLLFLSAYADLRDAIAALKKAVELLKQDIA